MYLLTTTCLFVCHSLSPDKRKLFCLFVCRGTLFYYGLGAFSLPIPHGMHLVVPTQFCLFGWYVIQTGHFPQKSPSKNLKIGFPFSPPLNHALLPLTYDLTVSCIGWIQAGEVWALRVPLFHICPKSACCSCVCRDWPAQSAVRFWLFSDFPFLYGLPYSGLGLACRWALLFFNPPFFLLPSLTTPLYHSCYEVVLPQSGWASLACHLSFSQWPSTAIDSYIISLTGSCVPFVFPWTSWVRLLSLGFLGPFLNFAFPWAFTEFFGLPWPNYIIHHPWDLWACHQPLTFFAFITLGLPWLIFTFPHHILPMVFFFSLSRLL